MPHPQEQPIRGPVSPYDPSRWFVVATIVGAAGVTLLFFGLMWPWNPAAAKGIAVGGVAGILGFWLISRRARSLPTIPAPEIPYRVYRWTFTRVLLYAMALFFAYLVDPTGRQALLGAAGGLFITRAVMMVTGIISWRRGVQAESGSK